LPTPSSAPLPGSDGGWSSAVADGEVGEGGRGGARAGVGGSCCSLCPPRGCHRDLGQPRRDERESRRRGRRRSLEEGERVCGAARRVGPWGWAAGAIGLQHPQDCATGEGPLHFAAGDALAAGAPTVAGLCAFWRCSMGCTNRWRQSEHLRRTEHRQIILENPGKDANTSI
jgi:hypothetical protein